MDYEQVRFNMIEQQIRPWEVLDPKVLDLLLKVKREDFVPSIYQSLAFVDTGIPLGHGEAMWAPVVEARALQSVQVGANDRVLEIGTGSGYFTALLAHQAQSVVTVEIHADLSAEADRRLHAHGLTNVHTRLGDGAHDWSLDGLFDVIVLTGSVPLSPETYLKRLNPGGRLFAIVGEGPAMAATLYTCTASPACPGVALFETVSKSLVNAAEPERFVF